MSRSLPRTLAALAVAALASGCGGGGGGGNDDATATAGVTENPGPTEGSAGTDGSDPTEGGGDTSDDPTEGGQPVSCEDGPQPGPTPRLVRLTHHQYDLTVADLLKLNLDPLPSAEFLADPAVAGFDNNAEQMVVKDRLGRDYRRAAERLAGEAVAPAALAALLPCQPEGDGSQCAAQFVTEFGRRAFRRPLTAGEQTTYSGLFTAGQGLYPEGTPFEQGIRFIIEAILQSPHFLYRVELSDSVDSDQVIPLGGYELASRLSYLLWGSMPDDVLLAAAEAGELGTPAGIEAQARRLLDSPKAEAPVADFHRQWLELDKVDNLQKNSDLYPEFNKGLAGAMREETQRFVRHVVFELEGDYAALLTAPVTFVNAELAALYGLQGQFGADFTEAALDPQKRAGILTQPSFLATHAYQSMSSPIFRGAFVQKQILCTPPPPPPGGIDPNLPPPGDDIVTTRDQVEAHTQQDPYCAGCHKGIINPPGFAFEHYDALGKWRDLDNGAPVDASGEAVSGAWLFSFTDAVDMVGQIGESANGTRCYLTNWFRYGYGRDVSPIDRCTIDALDAELAASGYNIKELLVSLTLTRTFRFRAVEE
ncbi:DUF1592 domain-containing protein [Nannocystis punicea]|uniref:DUF1592 domain-containing protein n=1 Tax=Nannocystis punicea TaxID=2995304 RepID=A0ABY7HFR9_9BACT|nr:DUF1592 domain-containing protein [Nannocystis poenicansa]WAS98141.1 DUF1592 domain-containing protein [Nannocystis poenicansa]